MNEMHIDELVTYEHDLWLLYQQASKITSYRKTMIDDRVLLNTPNVIDVNLLTEGMCEACECEPCECTQVYNEVEE